MDSCGEIRDNQEETNKRQRALLMEKQENPEKVDPDGYSDFDRLNEYVIEYLFNFLPLQDLKNCRLVNRQWNQLIVRQLRQSSHYISIKPWNRYPLGRKTDLVNVPQLLQLISSSALFPWTNFQVDGRVSRTTEDEENLALLFQGISPIVTKLCMYSLQKHLFPEKFQYPALRSLQLHCLATKESDEENLLEFILNIVEGSPKLETLCLSLNNLYMCNNFMEVMKCANARRVNRLLLRSRIENEHLIQLSEIGFQLKHLTLEFVGTDQETLEIGAGPLKAFLETQKMTLENLQFGEVAEDQNLDIAVEFPQMIKLSNVKIALPGKYPNLSIAQQLPKLRKLEFWFYEPGYRTLDYWFHSGMQAVETVEELKFTGDMTNPEIVLQAGRQFPNLLKLQVLASDELLDAVSQSMPKLKHLTLLFMEEEGEDVDSVLTNLSPQNCAMLRDLPPDDNEEMLGMERSWELRPCFQTLRKLELVSDHRIGITDLGCRLVLLKMEHLQNLQIVGDCTEISQDVLLVMQKQFGIHYGKK